jgi:glycosyltransferase involved in cell wall biosynthesis
MKILAIDPYLARSHRLFLEGLAKFSRHDFDLLTTPAIKWKWRMRTSGFAMGRALRGSGAKIKGPYDLVFASDFLSLPDFRAAAPPEISQLPCLYYFHENQLTYPTRCESEHDFNFCFINIASALAAEKALFNTEFHRQAFLAGAELFLKRDPGKSFDGAREEIERKSALLPIGIDPEEFGGPSPSRTGGPVLLWNHRWEYDKNPEEFFGALKVLKSRGMKFRLAVLGESFREYPPVFNDARAEFADRISTWGFVEDRKKYVELLQTSDIVVSTAFHEFFGLSVVEAMAAGCAPLLPNRLSYPEILPEHLHARHLYNDDSQLAGKLKTLIESFKNSDRAVFTKAVRRFSWKTVAMEFDEIAESIVK